MKAAFNNSDIVKYYNLKHCSCSAYFLSEPWYLFYFIKNSNYL